jgi:hypothetical protein
MPASTAYLIQPVCSLHIDLAGPAGRCSEKDFCSRRNALAGAAHFGIFAEMLPDYRPLPYNAGTRPDADHLFNLEAADAGRTKR